MQEGEACESLGEAFTYAWPWLCGGQPAGRVPMGRPRVGWRLQQGALKGRDGSPGGVACFSLRSCGCDFEKS